MEKLYFDLEHFICLYQKKDIDQIIPIAFYNIKERKLDFVGNYSFPIDNCFLCGKDLKCINNHPIKINDSSSKIIHVYNEYSTWYLLMFQDDNNRKTFLIDENSNIVKIFSGSYGVRTYDEEQKKPYFCLVSSDVHNVDYKDIKIRERKRYIVDFKQKVYSKLNYVPETRDSSRIIDANCKHVTSDYYIFETFDGSNNLINRNISKIPLYFTGSVDCEFNFLLPKNNYVFIDALVFDNCIDILAKDATGTHWILYQDFNVDNKPRIHKFNSSWEINRLSKTYFNTIEVLPAYVFSINGEKIIMFKGFNTDERAFKNIFYTHFGPLDFKWTDDYSQGVHINNFKNICFCFDNKITIPNVGEFYLEQLQICNGELRIDKSIEKNKRKCTILDTWDNYIAYKSDDEIKFIKICKGEFDRRNNNFSLKLVVPGTHIYKKGERIYIKLNFDHYNIINPEDTKSWIFDLQCEKFMVTPDFKPSKRKFSGSGLSASTLYDAFEGDVEAYRDWMNR